MKQSIALHGMLALLISASLVAALPRSDLANNIDHFPSTLDAPLTDMNWCGEDPQNDKGVVLLTAKGSVYRSEDRGASWQRMTDAFIRSSINNRMNLNQEVGTVREIMANPIDQKEMVFIGTEGVSWISTDCGQTVTTLGINQNLKEFQFHPTQRDWMLATSWTECGKKKDSDCVTTKDLLFSENKGKSWKVLTKYVIQFSWALKESRSYENSSVPVARILFSKELGNAGHQRIQGWNMKTHLFYTDDFMKTTEMIVNQGNKFLLSENFLFVAQVHSSSSQIVKLMVANANDKVYSFAYADVPEEIKQHSFTILDTSEGQIFLSINHFGSSSPLGTVYQSDSTGTRFSVSLHDNIRSNDGQCDFEKVNGVDGIYISNVYTSKKLGDIKQLLQSNNPDTSESDMPTEKQRKKGSQKSTTMSLQDQLAQLNESIQTRITFDKGGMWQPIKAPVKDSNGKQTNCDASKKCYLHLNSVSSQVLYGPTYSSENSVGLILATGSLGQNLSLKKGKVNTYMSRDGGLSWEEMKKGSHIYEVADHGSLIVMADDQEATDSIYFSWDEGKTWNTKKISETPITVSNIVTEPGNTSDKFIVYGSIEGDQDVSGIVVLLDFSLLHPRTCSGHETPENSDSDYEYWIPHNPNEICLLGREMKYVRRKRDAACFNPENFERPISVKTCECTEYDWECDVGYDRKDDYSDICNALPGTLTSYNAPDTCNGYYTVTQGYRKIAGNKCTGGVNHEAIKIPCPMFGFLSINGLFYNILLLAAMAGVFYLVVQNKEQVLAFVAAKKIDVLVFSVIAFVKKNLPTFSSEPQGYFKAQQIDEENSNGNNSKQAYSAAHYSMFSDDLIDHHVEEGFDHDEQVQPAVSAKVSSNKAVASVPQQQPVKQEHNLLDHEDDFSHDDPFHSSQ